MPDSGAQVEDRCQECSGSGFRFTQVSNDTRRQESCPWCGGSGKQSEAVARALSGEDVNKKKDPDKAGWWENGAWYERTAAEAMGLKPNKIPEL